MQSFRVNPGLDFSPTYRELDGAPTRQSTAIESPLAERRREAKVAACRSAMENAPPPGPVALHPPDWRGEYVRFPEAREGMGYLTQMMGGIRDGVKEHFEPFLAAGDFRPAAYEKMMGDMHRTVAKGGYTGWSGGLDSDSSIAPGSLIKNGPVRPGYRYWLSVDPKRIPESGTAGLADLPDGSFDVPLANLPAGAIGSNKITRDAQGVPHLYHQYLEMQYHDAALARMAALLQTFSDPAKPLPARLDAMAEYHHLGINTQLFHRVNNSLLMGQLNHVLHATGLRGIPHDVLDYHALLQPLSEYTPRFLAAVSARNPQL